MIATILVLLSVLASLLKLAKAEPSMNTSSSVIVIDIRSFEIIATAVQATVVVPVLTYN